MGFLNFLDPALDVLFQPVLALGPFWFVLIVSVLISFLIVIVYKFTTDQNLMKRLKDEIKELQGELRTLRDDKDKMMQVNRQIMETNMKYMMQSFKSSLYTLLPIILIYAYLNGAIAFEPIMPNEEFSVSVFFEPGVIGNVSASAPEGLQVTGSEVKDIAAETIFTFRGVPGEYLIEFDANNQTYAHTVLVRADGFGYAEPMQDIDDGIVQSIHTNLDKLVVLNLFGWQIGWFGAYIIFSIVGSIAFRRLLKVY